MRAIDILRDPATVADVNNAFARAGTVSPFAAAPGAHLESAPGMSPRDEAIVLLTGRPVVTIRNNTFLPPELGDRWVKSLTDAKERIDGVLPSIGRINVKNDPDFAWLATGWVVDEGIVVTNRHVAQEFALRNGQDFVFRRNPKNKIIEPSIDFRQEYLDPAEDIFSILKVLWIEDDGGPDIAFLVLGPSLAGTAARVPIPLATRIAPHIEVAAIGYPAEDGRRNDPEAEQKIFGDIYDVKRLAPGLVTSVTDTYLTHDCSTLGGNSGSALIALTTGEAVGLHFAGTFQESNYAVPAPVIAATLAKARAPRVAVPEALEMVPRNCHRQPYQKAPVPDFEVSGELIAYATPDSTWAVTKPLLEGAQRSILIGMYDFTAEYVRDALLAAMQRGVKVELMLDLDHRTGEDEIFDALVQAGCDGTSAPSCANDNPNARIFASSHEKVIVIDDEIVMVQSGNFTESSLPENPADGVFTDGFLPGNRDMGVVLRSRDSRRLLQQGSPPRHRP